LGEKLQKLQRPKIPSICPFAEDIAIKQITYGKKCKIDGMICFIWRDMGQFTKCPNFRKNWPKGEGKNAES